MLFIAHPAEKALQDFLFGIAPGAASSGGDDAGDAGETVRWLNSGWPVGLGGRFAGANFNLRAALAKFFEEKPGENLLNDKTYPPIYEPIYH